MGLPNLRHFQEQKVFSDPVEALVGEAWVPAIYTDRGWVTADGANLLENVQEWRNAAEETSNLGEHSPGNQSGQVAKTSTSNRLRQSRKKPQTQG